MGQRNITSILTIGFLCLALYIAYKMVSGIITEVNSQALSTQSAAQEISSPNTPQD